MGALITVLKRGLTIEGAAPIHQQCYAIGVLIESFLAGEWMAHHYHDPWRLFVSSTSLVLLITTLFTWLMRWAFMNMSRSTSIRE